MTKPDTTWKEFRAKAFRKDVDGRILDATNCPHCHCDIIILSTTPRKVKCTNTLCGKAFVLGKVN